MFTEIAYDSDLYRESLHLREQVLRAPLGLTLSASDTAGKHQQRHFGIVQQHTLLACLVVKTGQQPVAKLRQMAVAPVMQGQGLGKMLVDATELWLRQARFDQVELNARETAMGFYQSLGYRADGPVFQQVGIPHRCMHKRLA